LPLESFLHGRAAYAFYYVPILWLAWYAGARPTFLAVVLSLAAAWAFVVPAGQPGYRATIFVFIGVSIAMMLMGRAARRMQDAQAFLGSIVESSDDAIVIA
jgi:hypothetical protein